MISPMHCSNIPCTRLNSLFVAHLCQNPAQRLRKIGHSSPRASPCRSAPAKSADGGPLRASPLCGVDAVQLVFHEVRSIRIARHQTPFRSARRICSVRGHALQIAREDRHPQGRVLRSALCKWHRSRPMQVGIGRSATKKIAFWGRLCKSAPSKSDHAIRRPRESLAQGAWKGRPCRSMPASPLAGPP